MRSRRGFTLIELLVVIAILATIAVMVIYAFTPSGGEKMRSASRVGQSAILGARDRALHAKDRRGFRLVVDPNDTSIATGFVYIQPIPFQTYPVGSISLLRPDYDTDMIPDSQDILIVHGINGNDWYSLYQGNFLPGPLPVLPKIRIPSGSGGQWYAFTVDTSGPYTLSSTQPYFILTTSFTEQNPVAPPTALLVWDYTSSYSSCDIEIRNEFLPNHQPISLPSGIVIDLARSVPTTVGTQDIMFSPRGMITGSTAALGPIYLFLRDVRDVTNNLDPSSPQLQGDHAILAIFPQTGHVQAYPVDPTDNYINSSGALGNDNLADDPYTFAKRGSKAGG
jgi:prepilin-type N-terminal cleavage/methylation domain-containing protein